MRVAGRPRSPFLRRGLLIAAVVGGCFVWAMVFVGLSFGMVERGNRQWWVMPIFGLLMLAIAVVAVRSVVTFSARAGAARQQARAGVTRVPAEPLSPREIEVLQQLATGRSNQEIARALFVAPGTVKAHLNHIFRKLEAASRLQAVLHARQAGLLDPPPE
jgi:DNA-binding CsgD family transcriptional regulator